MVIGGGGSRPWVAVNSPALRKAKNPKQHAAHGIPCVGLTPSADKTLSKICSVDGRIGSLRSPCLLGLVHVAER